MKHLKGINLARLKPGFSDPGFEAQQTFRAVLDAMAHPGRVVHLATDMDPPKLLHRASAALCLTLLDFETVLWTDLDESSQAVDWLRFHCGCPLTTDPFQAAFALITRPKEMPTVQDFHPGEATRPELSTTLIIQVAGLDSRNGQKIAGPGIESKAGLGVTGVLDGFWEQWRSQTGFYPLGTDIVFTTENSMVALPRTSRPVA